MSAIRINRRRRSCMAVQERMIEQVREQLDVARMASRVYGETPGIAVIAPADLARLLERDPAAAWLTLARLTDAQLVIEAIDYTSWLNEVSGRDLAWGAVLDVFERRIARFR